MERTRFLARVRERLAGVETPPLPDELPVTPASGDGRPLVERFSEELQSVGGVVELVHARGLAAAVAAAARKSQARTAVIGPDLGPFSKEVTEGLGRAGVEVLRSGGSEDWREACERADLGVTGALLGVASSGSILAAAGPHSSRLASLLPSFHLVVLASDRLVPGFEEMFAVLPRYLTDASSAVLISGPSRTADIEMVLVRGVHGPREVHVLLVEGTRRTSRQKGRPAKAAGPSP